MAQIDDRTVVIIGLIVSFCLTVNAFFLKDILKTLKALELNFTTLNTEHGMYSRMVDKLDNELNALEKRFNKAQINNRERLHTLEGTFASMERHLDNSTEQ